VDGHEREDAVHYHHEEFIPQWTEIEPFKVVFEEDGSWYLDS
jgi:hypothetical protein